MVHSAYIDAINERMPEKVISDWVSNEDKLKAERLFENVKKGRIANTEIQQILLEVLTLNPYDDTIYMYWMQTYGDDNNSLERTAEYFGVTTFVRDKKAIVAILTIDAELMTEDNRCSPELAAKSLGYFIKLANQGNKKAQFHLGMIYMDGFGVTHDATQAISYYLKSAEQKFPNAQLALGSCYENGWGVTKDENQALSWYKKSAEQDNEFAKNALNQLKDKITARENTEKEIKEGIHKAVFHGRKIVYVILKFIIPPFFILSAVVGLSSEFFTGKSDFVDLLITALIILSLAALSWTVAQKIKPDNQPIESINNDSCTDINSPIPNKFPHLWHFVGAIFTGFWWSIGWALMYFFRDKNRYSKDLAAKALEYFHKANEENDAKAQYNLGLMYESGEGIVINKNQAMICYRKSSEQGNINAQNSLERLNSENLKQSSDVNDTDYLSRFKSEVNKLIKIFNL